MRINKFLSLCGLGARRKCEVFVEQNKVLVNGVVANLSSQVLDNDVVCVNGQRVFPKQFVYYMYHKPVGILCSFDDPHYEKKKTLKVLCNTIPESIFYAGRLDKNSSGLVLLSNDGEWIHRITAPKHTITKKYLVTSLKDLNEKDMLRFEQGLWLENKKTFPCKIRRLKTYVFEIVLHEGRKRQIREMFALFDNRVMTLHRFGIGNILLNTLPPGCVRALNNWEINSIFQ